MKTKTKKRPTDAEFRRRRERARVLYLQHAYRPPEMMQILIDEKFFDARQRAVALRWCQEEVARIRAECEPETVLRLQIPAQTERYRQQLCGLIREQLAVVNDDEMITRDKVTPKGDVVTVSEPRTSRALKGKALRALDILYQRLAILDGVDTEGELLREAAKLPPDPAKSREAFTFEFGSAQDENSLDALIDDNQAPN